MTADCTGDRATAAEPESLTPVPSPCNSVCRMDPNGATCVGCFRTLDEIARWVQLSDRERLLVIAAAEAKRTDTSDWIGRSLEKNSKGAKNCPKA